MNKTAKTIAVKSLIAGFLVCAAALTSGCAPQRPAQAGYNGRPVIVTPYAEAQAQKQQQRGARNQRYQEECVDTFMGRFCRGDRSYGSTIPVHIRGGINYRYHDI